VKLACLTLALSLAAGAASASLHDDAFAGYRDDAALSCEQLAGELGQIELDLRDMARAQRQERSDRRGASPVVFVGGITVPVEMVTATPGRLENGLQAAAQRQAVDAQRREARTRRSVLTGVYLSKDCQSASRRRDAPGRRGMGV
jgi:hypothetical protein